MYWVVVECMDTSEIPNLWNVRGEEKVSEVMFLDRYVHRFARKDQISVEETSNYLSKIDLT